MVQVQANPTNSFLLVLVLHYRVFDYENEDDDEEGVVAAPAAP